MLRRFQFRLRTLLIGVTLLAAAYCSGAEPNSAAEYYSRGAAYAAKGEADNAAMSKLFQFSMRRMFTIITIVCVELESLPVPPASLTPCPSAIRAEPR